MIDVPIVIPMFLITTIVFSIHLIHLSNMSQFLSQFFSLSSLYWPFTWSTSATMVFSSCSVGNSPNCIITVPSSYNDQKYVTFSIYQKAHKYPPDCIITVPSSKMINKMSIYFPFLRFIVTSISHKVSKSLIFMISFKAMMIEPPFLEMWPSREGPVKRL